MAEKEDLPFEYIYHIYYTFQKPESKFWELEPSQFSLKIFTPAASKTADTTWDGVDLNKL